MTKKLNNYLSIGKKDNRKDFSRNFTYHIYSTIDCIHTTAKIKLQKLLLKDTSEIVVGNPCFLSIAINSSPAVLVFQGTIQSIFDKDNSFVIEAVSYALPHEKYSNTFRDSNLKDIFVEFKNINVSAKELQIPQAVFQGSKCQSFINFINEFKQTNNTLLYFSTFYDHKAKKTKISVRNTIYLPDNKIYSIKSFTKFIQNKLTILPIPELRIGDKVTISDKTYTITALTLTDRLQTLSLSE